MALKSRLSIIEKAKSIVQPMVDPSDMEMHHLFNVSLHLIHAADAMESDYQILDDRTCGCTYIAQIQGG